MTPGPRIEQVTFPFPKFNFLIGRELFVGIRLEGPFRPVVFVLSRDNEGRVITHLTSSEANSVSIDSIRIAGDTECLVGSLPLTVLIGHDLLLPTVSNQTLTLRVRTTSNSKRFLRKGIALSVFGYALSNTKVISGECIH